MGTQAILLQALQALYHDPSSETRNAANQWLQDFQHSVEAWQVSDNLLHDPSSSLEALLFCAQTLKTKIQRDFDDLPPTAVIPLRESLLILLKRFRQGPASVRTQLCLGLAALAMHTSVDQWGSGGVVKWLDNELASEPEVALSLLELLTVLPQEAHSYKIAVRPERRRQFEKELVSSVNDAFNLLTAFLSQSSVELLEQVLRAFAAWLRYTYGMEASTLASHPLVAAALSGLNMDQTFDAAVDAVIELIRLTVNGSPGGLAEQMPLVQVLVPRVMALRARFTAFLKVSLAEKEARQRGLSDALESECDEEDQEVMKGMAHLFTEMAESYVELIANGSAEAMMIVEALTEVTSHPDDVIAEITYNFWYRLSCVLTKRDYYKGFESEAAFEVERERRLGLFRPTFEVLVSLVSYRVKYPPEFETWRKDELADFKQTRYAVAEVLMDAAAVLGGEVTLQLLSAPLFQGSGLNSNENTWDWQSVEAALYCIRGIAKVVPHNEAVVMPRIMALLPQFQEQPQLFYTAFLTIGAYADWLGVAHSGPILIPALLQLLTKGLAIPEDPAAAAALAFKHVCDACRNSLGGSINALVAVYLEAMSNNGKFQLSAEDELQIVEGLSMVVSAIPLTQTPQILEALILPLATSLQQLLAESQQNGSGQHLSSSQFIVPIDRLANIFRYVSQAEPLANVFKSLWALLKLAFSQKAFDVRIMERLCRLCKYAIRTCGRALGEIVGGLLEEVQSQFREYHHPCFLYLASEVIKVFSGDQSSAAYLGNLINVLFGQTINILTNIEDFTSHPDVADDCFLLASRCIRYCPYLLIPSPIFPSLFDCAMIGITIQHREACISILNFIKDAIRLCDSLGGKPFKATLDSVLLPRGVSLCRILIGALAGAVPESRIEEVLDVLFALAQLYGTQVVQWSENVIRLIPPIAVTEHEQKAFLEAVASAASGRESPVVKNSLEELSDVCRRNKKTMDLVRNVLKPDQLTLPSAA